MLHKTAARQIALALAQARRNPVGHAQYAPGYRPRKYRHQLAFGCSIALRTGRAVAKAVQVPSMRHQREQRREVAHVGSIRGPARRYF